MALTGPSIINAKVPARRYSRPYAITPSDTVTDLNLQRNGVPFKWLQNCGAGGMVMITWLDGTLMDVYLAQGQVIELGLPKHLMSTGTTAAGPFRAFLGMDGLGL
jgi:hypothetical protein